MFTKCSRLSGLLSLCVLLLGCAEGGPQLRAAQQPQDVRVVDGDSLVINGARIRLFGIDAPEIRQRCDQARGESWACGRWSEQMLRRMVEGQHVQCETVETDRYGRAVSRCMADGRDLSRAMVEEGAAIAFVRYSTDYVAAETHARRNMRGIWQLNGRGLQRPAQYRAERRRAQASPDTPPPQPGCDIKGNISSSGRIYHRPGQRDYARTRINLARGERWFCSEGEARAAGWRAARR